MKKILLLVSFITNISISQTLTIRYDSFFLDENDDYGNYYFDNATLVTSESAGIYTIVSKDTVVPSDRLGSVSSSSSDYKMLFYKDIHKNTIYYEEDRGGLRNNPQLIKDDTYQIDWEINENQKKILGYLAQEAVGKFRGRTYKVYFTTELPYSNGPFKFDGLPGLILEVISDDNTVSIKAKEVKRTAEEIAFPFDEKRETISWEEFKTIYKAYFEATISYRPSPDTQIAIPNRSIEYFIDK
ncbi:GLPGLI family protein [Flavobacterium sp.]|uniref:GLPGLI family protein n=1 Tax=Flavobacterium sp. TaxID=239 RepID=UPI0040341023